MAVLVQKASLPPTPTRQLLAKQTGRRGYQCFRLDDLVLFLTTEVYVAEGLKTSCVCLRLCVGWPLLPSNRHQVENCFMSLALVIPMSVSR